MKNSLHIYFTIHDIYGSGGTERVVLNLANALSPHYEITIISYAKEGKSLIMPISSDIKIICLDYPFPKRAFEKLRFNRYINALLSSGANALIASCNHFFPFIKKPRTTYIRLEHYNFDFLFGKYRHKTPLYPRVRFFDKMVILTSKEADLFRRLNPHICVIPNFLPQIPKESSDLSQKVVLSVGRMAHQKGFLRLLDIWARVQSYLSDSSNADFKNLANTNAESSNSPRSRILDEILGLCEASEEIEVEPSLTKRDEALPKISLKANAPSGKPTQLLEWKLVIVGSGEQQPLIESKIKELNLQDSVILKPFTKAIEKEYLSASIYAMSSYFEGFPMVLLEAGSAGLPLVAFDVATGPSDIIADSQSGFLVEDNDIESYARRLITLMSDENLRQKMGENAKKLVSEKFSKDGIMPLWEGLINGKGHKG